MTKSTLRKVKNCCTVL